MTAKNAIRVVLPALLLIWAFPFESAAQVYLFNDEVEVSGSVTAEFSGYSTTSNFKRRDPLGFRLLGNHRITYKGWEIPMNYVLGTYQDKFRQSFNKIGLSPEYKDWLTIHLGHRNVRFSPLTMAGKTILGAGVEIQRKRFRFGFIAGRFGRAIALDTTAANLPAYRRAGFAARVGYGTEHNYVDLIFLKGKDRESSLDSLQAGRVNPEENAVLGLRVYQRIIQRFYFEFDAALSAYSRDTRVGEPDNIDLGVANLMSVFLPLRKSNQYLFAIKSKLEYRHKQITAGLDYDRIEPDFQSMGAWYIRNDIERASLYTRFSVYKRKVNAFLRFGIQRNNLLNNRSANSFQNILNVTVNYIHSPEWNFRAGFSNYVTRQELAIGGISDSTLLEQRINNVNASVTHKMRSSSFNHIFRIHGGYQKSDNKAAAPGTAEFRSFYLNMLYRISPKKSIWHVAPTFILNSYKSAGIPATRYSPGFMTGIRTKDRKLQASLTSMFVFIRRDGEPQRLVFRNTLNASYSPFKKHTIGLRVSLANNDQRLGPGTYSEFQGEVRYTVRL